MPDPTVLDMLNMSGVTFSGVVCDSTGQRAEARGWRCYGQLA